MAVKVNIIIPAYNEENRLGKTFESYVEYFLNKKEYCINTNTSKNTKYILKVILVSDGSTDNTIPLAEKVFVKHNINSTIIEIQNNSGKGFAVKKGVLESDSADYYYLADADLSAKWDVLPKFLELIKNDKYDVVIGSRAVSESKVKTNAFKYIAGRISATLVNLSLNLDIKDTQCGYKLFSNKCLKAFELQTINSWGYDFEILYILEKMGLNILEKGITWNNVSGSRVSIGDYFATLISLLKIKSYKYNF